jgi:hypothetical protein
MRVAEILHIPRRGRASPLVPEPLPFRPSVTPLPSFASPAVRLGEQEPAPRQERRNA